MARTSVLASARLVEAEPVPDRHRQLPERWVVPAVLLAATASTGAVLALAGRAGADPAPSVLADAGALTRLGLPVAKTTYDLAGVATVGVVVVAVLLLRPRAGAMGPDALRLVRLAARWAAAWAVLAVLTALLTLSDTMAVPVWELLAPDVLPLAMELPQTRALVSSAWLAVLVAVWARWTRTPAAGGVLLLTAAAALVPPLLGGHAGHGENHVLAVTSLSLHVGAAAGWIGGLAALALHLRRSGAALVEALPRYSVLALGCFVAVGLSGLVTGWAALSSVDQLWTTPYGRLLLAKVGALLVLGALGHRHRRRTLAAAAQGRARAFLALAALELVLMASTAGLAVSLSRTPPPEPPSHAAAAPVERVLPVPA